MHEENQGLRKIKCFVLAQFGLSLRYSLDSFRG